MNPLDTEFHRRLKQWLQEAMDRDDEALRSGHLDHPDYKRVVGHRYALVAVMEACARIESDMNQGK